MEISDASSLVRQMLLLTLTVAAPVLLAGLIVGLVISLLQALTQIHEPAVALIPKIVAMAAAAILVMPWMSHRLIAFAATLFTFGARP